MLLKASAPPTAALPAPAPPTEIAMMWPESSPVPGSWTARTPEPAVAPRAETTHRLVMLPTIDDRRGDAAGKAVDVFGATDIVIDPRNPNRLYAATWDRHRTVAAYMGGGPGSGVWKSEDGGETWKQLETGLPGGPLGKIALAISPQKPDIVYATI